MHPSAKTSLSILNDKTNGQFFHKVCGSLIRRKWDYLQDIYGLNRDPRSIMHFRLNNDKKEERNLELVYSCTGTHESSHFQVRAKTAGRGPASCAAINCTHPGPRCGKILHLSLILAGSLASPLLHDYRHSRCTKFYSSSVSPFATFGGLKAASQIRRKRRAALRPAQEKVSLPPPPLPHLLNLAIFPPREADSWILDLAARGGSGKIGYLFILQGGRAR
jgi:hypothetical protein